MIILNKLLYFFGKIISPKPVLGLDYIRSKNYFDMQEPANDLIDASFKQYRAQKFLRGDYRSFILNILSFFLIVIFLLKNTFKRNKNLCVTANSAFIEFANRDALTLKRHLSFLPDEIHLIYNHQIGKSLSLNQIAQILSDSFKHNCIFEFYYILKIFRGLYIYNSLFSSSNVTKIYVSYEFSFICSHLTYFCSKNNIQHINIMHGDKLFNIRDSYSSFHICYVWDTFYRNLFKHLRSITPEYRLFDVNTICFHTKKNSLKNVKIIYYLGAESKTEMVNVCVTLSAISDRLNFSKEDIFIRPHPRYSKLSDVISIFNEFSIDLLNDECCIFCNSDIIISKFSSMLIRGYYANKTIFIDDVSDVEYTLQLKRFNYIGFHYKFSTVSSIF